MQAHPSDFCPVSPMWRRLLALAYDLLLVLAIMIVAVMIGLLLSGGQLVDARGNLQAWWFPPFEGALVAIYFIASWRRGGQTVGMRCWHIRITGYSGGTPSLRQATIRLVVAALPLLTLALTPWAGVHVALMCLLATCTAWFAVACVDSRGRTLHDLVVSTEVHLIRQTSAPAQPLSK